MCVGGGDSSRFLPAHFSIVVMTMKKVTSRRWKSAPTRGSLGVLGWEMTSLATRWSQREQKEKTKRSPVTRRQAADSTSDDGGREGKKRRKNKFTCPAVAASELQPGSLIFAFTLKACNWSGAEGGFIVKFSSLQQQHQQQKKKKIQHVNAFKVSVAFFLFSLFLFGKQEVGGVTVREEKKEEQEEEEEEEDGTETDTRGKAKRTIEKIKNVHVTEAECEMKG